MAVEPEDSIHNLCSNHREIVLISGALIDMIGLQFCLEEVKDCVRLAGNGFLATRNMGN